MIPADTEEMAMNYDYVISAEAVQHARRLLQVPHHGRAVWSIWTLSQRPSILDLAGLGREIWQGVNAKEYIQQLRGEWDAR
jgi:hypothetical protein